MPRQQALLLINPRSRSGGEPLQEAITVLERGGVGVVPVILRPEADVGALIARHRGRIDRVVVGGGDGTVNAALAAVLESGLPLGVLPLGTANDFARSIGLPLDPAAACEAVAGGKVRRIDVGRANDRHFLNVAHIGLAVDVARRSDRDTKKRFGALAYPYAVWRAFRHRRAFTAFIQGGHERRRLRAIQVSVGNGRFYGGGVPVAEDAAIDDGRLDLYAIPARPGRELLALMPALRRGRVRGRPDIVSLRGARFDVRTRRPKTVSLDGEAVLKTPVRFEVLPAALPVFVPG